MSKRKNKKNSNNNNKNFNFPFNNEISLAKHNFKQMIDEMPNDIFIDFCSFINSSFNIFDEDWIEEQWEMDEDWEDEAEVFYNHYDNSDEDLTLFDDDSLPF